MRKGICLHNISVAGEVDLPPDGFDIALEDQIPKTRIVALIVDKHIGLVISNELDIDGHIGLQVVTEDILVGLLVDTEQVMIGGREDPPPAVGSSFVLVGQRLFIDGIAVHREDIIRRRVECLELAGVIDRIARLRLCERGQYFAVG